MGAGLADPDGVWVVPFDLIAEPTDNLAGLAGVEVITLRVGILVGVPSSVIVYDDCGEEEEREELDDDDDDDWWLMDE